MQNKRIEEFDELLDSIEQSYGIFYTLSKIGRPVFVPAESKDVPSACVGFDKQGCCIEFMFNEGFWDSITPKERKFVIYHEMLHVIYSHGIRTIDTKTPQATNVCLDIVVNEKLLSDYNFNRKDLPNLFEMKRVCLIENIFPDRKDVKPEQCYEYYYGLYKKDMAEAIKNGKVKVVLSDTLDGHDSLSEFIDDEAVNEIVEKLQNELSTKEVERLDKKLTEEEKKDQKTANANGDSNQQSDGGKKPGTISAGIEKILGRMKIVKKRKWETVINKFTEKYTKVDKVEHWSRQNYRLTNLHSQFEFPGNLWYEHREKNRVGLLLALDTSGSCVHLAERFYRAALSIPDDTFDVHIINFDTRAFYVSKEDALLGKSYGHGGTCIRCIEEYIQTNMVPNGKYPDACFVVTDGEFNPINRPEKAERWQFFLSKDDRRAIPADSKVHLLQDFE